MRDYNVNYVSIVVPVYNEEGCLRDLIRRVVETMDKTAHKYELVMVDDGSRDATPEIMREAVAANPGKLVGCYLNRNYGQHSAIMAGFSIVRGDLIITIDADLQNPPEEIPNLVAAAEQGNDVVGTIRKNRKDTFFRRYASKAVNYMARKATGVNMKDYGCMLRAYRRHIVDAMLLCDERSTFIPVLANTFARTTCEIEVGHDERAVGESKYSLWKLINLQFNLLTCMTTAPLRMLTYIGILAAVLGFCIGLFILGKRIFDNDEVWMAQGIFTLFAVMFILSGTQLAGMGLLGEYIGRIYVDVRARPRYFIEEVIGQEEAEK